MAPVGFEPAISANKRPQTYALECTATGTGPNIYSRQNVRETIAKTVYDSITLTTAFSGVILCNWVE